MLGDRAGLVFSPASLAAASGWQGRGEGQISLVGIEGSELERAVCLLLLGTRASPTLLGGLV